MYHHTFMGSISVWGFSVSAATIVSLTTAADLSTPRSVLSLDIGRRTGWALASGDAGAITDSGVHELYAERRKAPFTDGERFLALYNFLVERHNSHGLDVIVFEQVSGGTKGRQTTLYNGYRSVLILFCQNAGIPCIPLAVTTIKKAVTGTGRGRKDGVMKAIRERGFAPFDDNESDAIAALLTYQKMSIDKAERIEETAKPKRKPRASKVKPHDERRAGRSASSRKKAGEPGLVRDRKRRKRSGVGSSGNAAAPNKTAAKSRKASAKKRTTRKRAKA